MISDQYNKVAMNHCYVKGLNVKHIVKINAGIFVLLLVSLLIIGGENGEGQVLRIDKESHGVMNFKGKRSFETKETAYSISVTSTRTTNLQANVTSVSLSIDSTETRESPTVAKSFVVSKNQLTLTMKELDELIKGIKSFQTHAFSTIPKPEGDTTFSFMGKPTMNCVYEKTEKKWVIFFLNTVLDVEQCNELLAILEKTQTKFKDLK